MSELLKLRAEDLEDLEVISACLQDALTSVSDMAFLSEEARFAVVFSRFMWEVVDPAPGAEGMRIRSGLHFEGVRKVVTQGVDQEHRTGLIPLLALTAEATTPGVEVTFEFGGGGRLRLEADSLDARLSDTGSPWPTANRPDHALDGDGQG